MNKSILSKRVYKIAKYLVDNITNDLGVYRINSNEFYSALEMCKALCRKHGFDVTQHSLYLVLMEYADAFAVFGLTSNGYSFKLDGYLVNIL